MKKTIGFYDFKQGFIDYNRDYFTDSGYHALFDYLEEVEDDCGIDIEYDVIGICCDFTEYESLDYLASDYGYLYTMDDYKEEYDIDDDEEIFDSDYFNALIEHLENYTTVIPVGDCDCILQAF